MTDQPITHKSPRTTLNSGYSVLETSNNNRVKCKWSGRSLRNRQYFNQLSFEWNFDWKDLKDTGVDGLSGHIIVTSCFDTFSPQTVFLDFTSDIDSVQKIIPVPDSSNDTYVVNFAYSLIPHKSTFNKEVLYNEMFMPSELADTILVVDKKKLHVNKAFLSFHSEFFRALFSSNFKEGQMDEIPIQDVSYADFGLLMSSINPKTAFANDETVEKLLELADRFLMPAVVCQCEHHLLNISKIELEEKIWMADKYDMPMLLEKCIRDLNTVEKARKVGSMEKYSDLSKETVMKIFKRTLQLL